MKRKLSKLNVIDFFFSPASSPIWVSVQTALRNLNVAWVTVIRADQVKSVVLLTRNSLSYGNHA